jgi:uncharacterized protein
VPILTAPAPGAPDGPPLATAALALLTIVLVGAYLALRRALGRAVAGSRTRALAGVLVPWLAATVYAAASGQPVAARAAGYAAYLLAPALVVVGAPRRALAGARGDVGGASEAWRTLVAIALLWLPIEFRLLPPLVVPVAGGADVARFLGLVGALWLFLVARPLPGVGYSFALRARDVGLAVAAFAAFAVVAVPIGLATGFVAWNPQLGTRALLTVAPLVYLTVAVPEEFLFRGLIQNTLAGRLPPGTALGVASVIFGLAHLPDPRYVLLATIAGVAYGWVYRRTGRVTAAAITHALVDVAWVLLLRR